MSTYTNQQVTSATDQNKFTLIPVEKLINYRKAAAYKAAKRRGFAESIYPEYFTEFENTATDDQDLERTFQNELSRIKFESYTLKENATALEFADRSVLTTGYRLQLQKAAKTSQRKRESRKTYNERVESSQMGMLAGVKPLGNTGNNLDNYEKPCREKRYRIQNFIQKNRLASNNVCTCGQPIGDFVHLKKNLEFGNVSTSGIATCGSVWACPVCRSKIVNQRAKELNEIYKKGSEKGYYFHLITFTFSHSFKDNLAELYGSSNLGKGLSGAFTKFRSSRVWSKDFKKQFNLVGDVRSVEITFGFKNGFHPHIHLAVITEKDFPVDYWEKKFLQQWQKNCKKAGLGVPNEKGVKVDKVRSSEMITYLSKWSVGSELSSDSAKEAKGGNYSIAALEYMMIDEYERGIRGLSLERISGIMKSYYAAMKGQKQLVYGGRKGWKKELLKEDELSDEQISAEDLQDEKIEDLVVFEKRTYQELKKTGVWNDLIEAVEYVSYDTPNYKDMIYNLIRTIFQSNDIPESGLYSLQQFKDRYG